MAARGANISRRFNIGGSSHGERSAASAEGEEETQGRPEQGEERLWLQSELQHRQEVTPASLNLLCALRHKQASDHPGGCFKPPSGRLIEQKESCRDRNFDVCVERAGARHP